MKFEEILLPLKEGKKITRKAWDNVCIYCVYHALAKKYELQYAYINLSATARFRPFGTVILAADDFFADDWEILTDSFDAKKRCSIEQNRATKAEVLEATKRGIKKYLPVLKKLAKK